MALCPSRSRGFYFRHLGGRRGAGAGGWGGGRKLSAAVTTRVEDARPGHVQEREEDVRHHMDAAVMLSDRSIVTSAHNTLVLYTVEYPHISASGSCLFWGYWTRKRGCYVLLRRWKIEQSFDGPVRSEQEYLPSKV